MKQSLLPRGRRTVWAASFLVAALALTGAAPEASAADPGGLRGWAYVFPDGTIFRSRNVAVAKSGQYGTGRYEVFFQFRIRNCTFSATTTDYNVTIAVGEAHLKPRSVFVEVRNSYDQAGTDSAFHLQVFCPPGV